MTQHFNRVPLKQEDFIMRIIKDLGIVERPEKWKIPKRAVILECIDCKAHVEKDTSNGKTAKHCDECKNKHSSLARTKPLDQKEFTMKIIKDLGKTTASDTTTNLGRYAIFECTDCKLHFKARASGKTAKEQKTCNACALRSDRMYSHPLYPVWNGIKQRCYSPIRKDYHRYGALGVTMADEWVDDPAAFILWCENNGWKPGLAVDKDIKCRELSISPAIYSPATVTFVTPSQNAREASGVPINQYTLDGVYIKTFNSAIEAGESLGLKSGNTITNVCRKRQHTTAGFKWAYADTKS